MTDIDALRALFLQLQPRIVIHSASPVFFQDPIDQTAFPQTNVIGTRNLLEIAATIKSVHAFVYISSSVVHARSTEGFLKETAPLVDRSTSSDEYAISKAIADKMVLTANGSELRTLCLRLPVIYGERDTQMISGSLAVLRDKKTHIQLGDNTNLYDAIYVGNAALAHVAAAKALLRAEAAVKVDGEAFLVTDDAALPFWDFQRKIWAAAGVTTQLKQVQVIPAWVGMTMAALLEYFFLIFTLGRKLPPKSFRRGVLRYATEDRSHCIDKAKERLHYRPLIDTDQGIRRAVAWTLQQHPSQSDRGDETLAE
ncbi:MAG: hypothetical protein Q9208_007622 [Pyrenodesmia sp. 3 TL-2023]